MQKITPNLWFNKEAEEAAQFYTSIFKNSSIGEVSRYGKEGFEVHGQKEGTAMTVSFTLDRQNFLALDGGPLFHFTEAISFIVDCKDQEEIDYFWEKLGEGGDPNAQQCGWLKDKYGVSWQIIPSQMGTLMSNPDKDKAGLAMNAMLKMKKIIISDLEAAAN